MRLWHKDLIPYLPYQQLIGQWRECCLIARNISYYDKPNHILVNKVVKYPLGHLWQYGVMIAGEKYHRGFVCDFNRFEQWFANPDKLVIPSDRELFADWHNERYLDQCYYNIQEKYDCGGVPEKEWQRFYEGYKYLKGE